MPPVFSQTAFALISAFSRKDAKGKERSARFMCNIAAVLPDGRVLHTEAAMEGEIAKEAAGNGGFGYDPILWLPEYGKTSIPVPAS